MLSTPYYRRSSKEDFKEKNSWKTKNNVIGCIDAKRRRECDWLRKAERKGTWQRNLASMRKNLRLGRKHQQQQQHVIAVYGTLLRGIEQCNLQCITSRNITSDSATTIAFSKSVLKHSYSHVRSRRKFVPYIYLCTVQWFRSLFFSVGH